jgi:hypothetical protein
MATVQRSAKAAWFAVVVFAAIAPVAQAQTTSTVERRRGTTLSGLSVRHPQRRTLTPRPDCHSVGRSPHASESKVAASGFAPGTPKMHVPQLWRHGWLFGLGIPSSHPFVIRHGRAQRDDRHAMA